VSFFLLIPCGKEVDVEDVEDVEDGKNAKPRDASLSTAEFGKRNVGGRNVTGWDGGE